MFTFFACPKPFDNGHSRAIQRNAIRSWLLLKPRPQVILFGNEVGVAETCAEFSILHVPEVAKNEFGTPLLNDIFEKAEKLSQSDLLCYVNADILMTSSFCAALKLVAARKRRFLMGGRPWDLDIREELAFDSDWEQTFSKRVAQEGELRSVRSCDFFAFPKGMWGRVPPFAVGRAWFDNALMYRARRMGAALVDATEAVISIHQNHWYPDHLCGNRKLDNTEAKRNVALAGGPARLFTWKSATHIVEDGRVRFRLRGYLRIFGPESWVTKFVRESSKLLKRLFFTVRSYVVATPK